MRKIKIVGMLLTLLNGQNSKIEVGEGAYLAHQIDALEIYMPDFQEKASMISSLAGKKLKIMQIIMRVAASVYDYMERLKLDLDDEDLHEYYETLILKVILPNHLDALAEYGYRLALLAHRENLIE